MKKVKNNRIFKLFSLILLSTTSIFAALYAIEYVRPNSNSKTKSHVTAQSFTVDNLKYYFTKTPDVSYNIAGATEKDGKNFLFNNRNFGAIIIDTTDRNCAEMVSGPDFHFDPSNPTAVDMFTSTPIISTIGDLQKVSYGTGTKGLPTRFGNYSNLTIYTGVPTMVEVYLVYFLPDIEKRWDNFQYVYTEDESAPISQKLMFIWQWTLN